MRIISYRDLAPGQFAKSVEKISTALTRGDFAFRKGALREDEREPPLV
jgi:hypothetical protein